MAFRILTVCTANVCRSPLAEGLLRARLDSTKFEVASAGIRAYAGAEPHPLTVAALQERGAPPLTTTADELTPGMLKEADLVLTATREHRGEVLEVFPGALRRTFTLLEFAALAPLVEAAGPIELVREAAAIRSQGPSEADIPDPIGRGEEFYRAVSVEIDASVSGTTRALCGGNVG